MRPTQVRLGGGAPNPKINQYVRPLSPPADTGIVPPSLRLFYKMRKFGSMAVMRCPRGDFDELRLVLIFFFVSWLGDWGSFGELTLLSNGYNG